MFAKGLKRGPKLQNSGTEIRMFTLRPLSHYFVSTVGEIFWNWFCSSTLSGQVAKQVLLRPDNPTTAWHLHHGSRIISDEALLCFFSVVDIELVRGCFVLAKWTFCRRSQRKSGCVGFAESIPSSLQILCQCRCQRVCVKPKQNLPAKASKQVHGSSCCGN